MVLKYKFKYNSNNENFINILNNILIKKDIDYSLDKKAEYILLFIKDDEENLLKISDELSKELPISIFLEDFELEIAPQFQESNYQFTPYENKNEIESKNYKEDFKKLAFYISENKKIKIGDKIISKLNILKKDYENIICDNSNNLSKIIVGSKQKTTLLNSLEKPIILFNVNVIYQKNNNSNVKKIYARTPWNNFYYSLFKELKKLDIEFLKYSKNVNYDLEVEFNDEDESPKISITQNKLFILKNRNYDKDLDVLYNGFNEKSKGQFMTLLKENNLFDKTILNLYLSTSNEDLISLYSPKIDGIIDFFKITLPKNIDSIYEAIKKDENGEKLLNNFKDKFPKTYEKSLDFDMSNLKSNSMISVFKIVSSILGIENIHEKASSALMQKGPSIDFIIEKKDEIFNKEFNMIKLIKSGMSFKLAGVDDKTLALGYFESFARFLSSLVDEVNEKFSFDGLGFCGDLIADDLFSKLLNKSITQKTKLYYNKDFPIQL